jgi:hypothetical protein
MTMAAHTQDGLADSARRIWWIGGSKGGVGKSMMTLAALDYFLEDGRGVTLVECDTSNPDVGKAYHGVVRAMHAIDLDTKDGWLRLVNVCGENTQDLVVINTAARSNGAVREYGELLGEAAPELGGMVALWVINRQRDSLELLKEFLELVPHAELHVVRNRYFGKETQFDLYESSHVRTVVEGRGGKTVTLDDLADRVVNELYSQRLPIAAAARSMPIGNRAELQRWRREVRKLFEQLGV